MKRDRQLKAALLSQCMLIVQNARAALALQDADDRAAFPLSHHLGQSQISPANRAFALVPGI
jgi:hypothetical protein